MDIQIAFYLQNTTYSLILPSQTLCFNTYNNIKLFLTRNIMSLNSSEGFSCIYFHVAQKIFNKTAQNMSSNRPIAQGLVKPSPDKNSWYVLWDTEIDQ